MFRLPAGQQVQIQVVAQDGGGHHRVLLVQAGKLGKGIAGLGVNDGPVLNPADLVLLGLHLEEAPAVFENLELLAVDHLGHAIGDCRYPVAQVHLAHRDIHHLMLLVVKAVAARDQGQKAERNQQRQRAQQLRCSTAAPDERDEGDWRLRGHNRWRSP